MTKELHEMSFEELATYNQACILMAIPKGDFNYAVWRAMDLTLQWKALMKQQEMLNSA